MEARARRGARVATFPERRRRAPGGVFQVREHMAAGEVLNRRFRKENLIL
jgi:hypothetical protein